MLALCGGTIVTSLDPPEVTDADLVLAGERVLAVGAAPRGAARRDATGTLIVPGAVCAHHHLYSALARGMPFRLAAPPASPRSCSGCGGGWTGRLTRRRSVPPH